MTVDERLKQIRERAGLSQGQLHTYTGVAQSTLSNLENGTGQKTLSSIAALAKYYGVSTDYLLCLTDDPTPAGDPSAIQLLYDQLPADRQQDLLDQADLWLLKKSGDYRRELVKRLMIEEEDKDLADQLKILLDEDEPEDEE